MSTAPENIAASRPFVVEPYNSRDVPALYELAFRSFGWRAVPGVFEWKFLANPAGPPIGYVARSKDTGELAGFYGVIPEQFYIQGRAATVYQSCDTMTHSSFRRRGIFETLAKATYGTLERAGQKLVYGFAGDMSFPGFVNKLGWRAMETIRASFVPSPSLRLHTLLSKRIPAGFKVERSQQYHPALADLDDQLRQQRAITISRTRQNLEWRLAQPGFVPQYLYLFHEDGRLAGYVIVRTTQTNLMQLLDLALPVDAPQQLTSHLLNLACREAVQCGARALYGWVSRRNPIARAMRLPWFLKNPFKRGPMNSNLFFILLENGVVAPSPLVLDENNWHLTSLYHDA